MNHGFMVFTILANKTLKSKVKFHLKYYCKVSM